ncbi:MAG TPA: hypothetical protein VLL08_20250 [Kineosporiaceae bacterium]|nr:hypothetical protein [Kineosporiaceae bacterium]
MSVETKTVPIVVRIPRALGLSEDQVAVLEDKWKADLTSAVSESGAKIKVKWSIKIHIEIGNE